MILTEEGLLDHIRPNTCIVKSSDKIISLSEIRQPAENF